MRLKKEVALEKAKENMVKRFDILEKCRKNLEQRQKLADKAEERYQKAVDRYIKSENAVKSKDTELV